MATYKYDTDVFTGTGLVGISHWTGKGDPKCYWSLHLDKDIWSSWTALLSFWMFRYYKKIINKNFKKEWKGEELNGSQPHDSSLISWLRQSWLPLQNSIAWRRKHQRLQSSGGSKVRVPACPGSVRSLLWVVDIVAAFTLQRNVEKVLWGSFYQGPTLLI